MNKSSKHENSLYKFKRVHQLVFQYQIFSYENIHTNNIMHVEQLYLCILEYIKQIHLYIMHI